MTGIFYPDVSIASVNDKTPTEGLMVCSTVSNYSTVITASMTNLYENAHSLFFSLKKVMYKDKYVICKH